MNDLLEKEKNNELSRTDIFDRIYYIIPDLIKLEKYDVLCSVAQLPISKYGITNSKRFRAVKNMSRHVVSIPPNVRTDTVISILKGLTLTTTKTDFVITIRHFTLMSIRKNDDNLLGAIECFVKDHDMSCYDIMYSIISNHVLNQLLNDHVNPRKLVRKIIDTYIIAMRKKIKERGYSNRDGEKKLVKVLTKKLNALTCQNIDKIFESDLPIERHLLEPGCTTVYDALKPIAKVLIIGSKHGVEIFIKYHKPKAEQLDELANVASRYGHQYLSVKLNIRSYLEDIRDTIDGLQKSIYDIYVHDFGTKKLK